MKIICSYCRSDFGEKEPLDDDRISHSMCSDCYDHFQKQFAGLSFNEYLDEFNAPVFIVNGDGRIAASNKLASDMLGKSQEEIFGLLGGEAMECSYARLPEGCGNTIHCETCTIRNTVMRTMGSRKTQKNAAVKLLQNGRSIEMIVSTYYIDGFVQIVIEA